MSVAAVIAEYNPFHNGHALHIARTRELYGATHIVAIMSGDFVQRGDCACLSKHTRAHMALLGGADLVIELPLPWCMSGAERFTLGGVALACALGCVDMLSFGSESGSIDDIRACADAVDSPAVAQLMREHLSDGITFAAARTAAVRELYGDRCAEIIASPNDTLGVDYCRALTRLGSTVRPVCVRREGAAHDSSIENPAGSVISASQVRALLSAGEDISPYIPQDCMSPLLRAVQDGFAPAELCRIDRAVLLALRRASAAELALLPEISEGLQHRIARCAGSAVGFADLCDAVKCKRYTHSRIRRAVLSDLLGLREDTASQLPPYIRILGMNRRGREILAAASPSLPLVSRYTDIEGLCPLGREVFDLGMNAADVFGLCTPSVMPCGRDASHKLIVLD